MAIIDQAAGVEYDLYKVRLRSATEIAFRYGGTVALNGDGRSGGAIAAEWGLLVGIIREQELASGSINHALSMTVLCSSGQPGVYPSRGGSGTACNDPKRGVGIDPTDAPAIGMQFQLVMTDQEINDLPVPNWKKTILRAMAHYGMFVGDTGGGTAWGIQLESGVTYTSFGYEDRLWLFGESNGFEEYTPDGSTLTTLVARLAGDVTWASRLRVIDPCVSAGTC